MGKKDRSSEAQGIENKVETKGGVLNRDETARLQAEEGRAGSAWPKVGDVVLLCRADGRTENDRAFTINYVHSEGTRGTTGQGKAVDGYFVPLPRDEEFNDGRAVTLEHVAQGNPGEPGTWHYK